MDILINVKIRLEEYTSTIYVDYERESILLEVHKDYFDEVMMEVKKYIDMDVTFVKEIKNNHYTIVISTLTIIDVYDSEE
tara:strand:- start:352 stop:591 length:240 start_codon:yes stop_codon:yes gene_type:complete